MEIFVINLDTAEQRLEELRQHFSNSEVTFTRFPAVTPATSADYFSGTDNWINLMEVGRQPAPAEIAAYASHKTLWIRCIELNRPIIIMEDDILLRADFLQAVTAIHADINSYGFVRLEDLEEGWHWWDCGRPVEIKRYGDYRLYLQQTPSLRTSAYAISPSAAGKLVAATTKMDSPVDHFIRRTWLHRQPLFSLSPAPVYISTQADDTTIPGRRSVKRSYLIRRIRKLYKYHARWQQQKFNKSVLAELRG